MNTAFLQTGGNLGDREKNLSWARQLINEHCGHILRASSIYETAAWGNADQPDFLNQVLQVETALNARQLVRRILKIEKTMGRERKEKYGPRLIDIDILLFNDEIHNYHFLRVPHPELQNRRFALIPLNELAPQLIHPVFHQTIAQLLENCADPLPVRKYA